MELLTTGVDVPGVRNIAFFRYMKSPIAFYQMIGRGTRIDEPTGKLMFTRLRLHRRDAAVRRAVRLAAQGTGPEGRTRRRRRSGPAATADSAGHRRRLRGAR